MTNINWKQRIDYFEALEEQDLDLFAPPGEVYRVARSYNTALALYVAGKTEEALASLAQISEDYPLFPQASHLYAVLLAAEGEYEAAELILGRVRLLELEEPERKQIEEEYLAVQEEAAEIRRENLRFRRREEMLQPVKKQIAIESILQKAPDLEAGSKEAYSDRSSLIWENPQEKRKTFNTIAITLGIAILVLLLFFFFWRPEIKKQQARQAESSEKIAWLEEELLKRAADSSDLAVFLAEYQDWLQAGRPAPSTTDPATSPESSLESTESTSQVQVAK